jgi:hypothetical protein
VLFVKTGLGLWSHSFRNPRDALQQKTMKNTAFFLSLLFLAGCAAPPPVKIASKLLGRTVLQQANDEGRSPETTQTTPQE